MLLSKWSYVPRLLPAPQALIRSSRPERLSPSSGQVIGSHSGNVQPQLNHIASILHHNGTQLPDYAVKIVRLQENPGKRPEASANGPLTVLAIIGMCLSTGLTVASIYMNDGMSLLATIILSVLSSLVGIGSRWKLEMPSRRETRKIPNSDVVIAYNHGAFMVVQCTEEAARQLYWHPEKCHYLVSEQWYRFISLLGTLFLMGAFISLANATVQLQIAWAGCYVFLNAAYWVVAALPARMHWDLSSYTMTNVEYTGGRRPKEAVDKDKKYLETDYEHWEENKTFTEALWKVIAITRCKDWARITNVAPNTKNWDLFMLEAEQMAQSRPVEYDDGKLVLPEWDWSGTLSDILNQARADGKV